MSWPVVPFLSALVDATGGQIKVQKKDYLDSGQLPVIDQGQSEIGGFTNELKAQAKVCLPVILFGDHTRTFKLVRSPFAIGADGVKVLVPRDGFNAEFLFFYLQSLDLPSHGYSRHFKFLKEVSVPKPPLDEQRRIIDILNHAAGCRRLRQQALEKTRALIPAVFVEMFGDPVSNPKGWPTQRIVDIAEVQGGLQITKERAANSIEVPYLRVANVHRDRLDLSEIKTMLVTASEFERTALTAGDILVVEGHGNKEEIGRCAVWDGSIPRCTHQNHLIRVRPNEGVMTPQYLNAFLNSENGRRQLLMQGKTTSGLNTISTSNVKACIAAVPPLYLQRYFVDRVSDTASLIAQQERHLAQADALMQSLMARFFGGAAASVPAAVPSPVEVAKARPVARRVVLREPLPLVAEETASYSAAAPGKPAVPDKQAITNIPQRLLAHMHPNRAYSRADLMAAAGISAADWTWAIRQLKEEGRVRQSGEKRGARYSLKK